MTGTKLQELLDAHCLEMKANMPGFLFYGILSCKDGTILSKASANEESSRIVEQGSAFHLTIVDQVKKVMNSNKSMGETALGKFFSITALDRPKSNIGISRALLYKCKAEFGTMLDDFF